MILFYNKIQETRISYLYSLVILLYFCCVTFVTYLGDILMKSIKELFAKELEKALANAAVKTQGQTPPKTGRVIPATTDAVVIKIRRSR